jgi:hypothetical protein
MIQQISWVLVNAIGARSFQFFPTVATREQTYSQRSGSSGGKKIPNTIPHYKRLADLPAETLVGQREIDLDQAWGTALDRV